MVRLTTVALAFGALTAAFSAGDNVRSSAKLSQRDDTPPVGTEDPADAQRKLLEAAGLAAKEIHEMILAIVGNDAQ